MIETSIIFGHYSEDKERDEIAWKSFMSIVPEKNETAELIVVFNGIYPYQYEYLEYIDQWQEREADPFPGRTFNLGIDLAKGKYIFYMSNDVLIEKGAVKECVRLLKEYPQYWVTPFHAKQRKARRNKLLPNGYWANDRCGDTVCCMTKQQIVDVGRMDEVACFTDMINYVNRRIAKGYTVMMTENPMAYDMAEGIHSFKKQIEKYHIVGYKREKPIYNTNLLKKLSY